MNRIKRGVCIRWKFVITTRRRSGNLTKCSLMTILELALCENEREGSEERVGKGVAGGREAIQKRAEVMKFLDGYARDFLAGAFLHRVCIFSLKLSSNAIESRARIREIADTRAA